MTDWDWTIKVAATIAVNLALVIYLVWLFWFSRLSKSRAEKEDVR